MTFKYIQKGILSLLVSFTCCLSAESANTTSDWIWEDSSGKAQITCVNDTLDIIAPEGLSLWYEKRLTGNYEIEYSIQIVMEDGLHDRLSDLNCFWAANDPKHPDNLFARSSWRNGIFDRYNSLNLFYVGYGGNENKTTRFRKYHGVYYNQDSQKIKPILKEYKDSCHLLKPNHWYKIKIKVEDNMTTYQIDGKKLFSHSILHGEGDGHFAIRLWKNHARVTGFKINKRP